MEFNNKQMDVVLSFDTTLSMSVVLNKVRENLSKLVNILFQSDLQCRVAIIAHGDYDSTPYTLKYIDFTSDVQKLVTFIEQVKAVQNSWNEGESYEQSLYTAMSLNWESNSEKIMIIVGDDIPHEPDFEGNQQNINWRECMNNLTVSGVRFYSIQCASLEIQRAQTFYKTLASANPQGQYLLLEQFYMIPELLMAVLMHATGNQQKLINHQQNMKEQQKRQLINDCINQSNPQDIQQKPVRPNMGKFQRLRVEQPMSIKDFVTANGAIFKTGRGFYELTKKEKVSLSKEIIVEDINSGDVYSGAEARQLLDINGGVLEPTNKDKYRIFIQSTSCNRKLVANSWFLYELSSI